MLRLVEEGAFPSVPTWMVLGMATEKITITLQLAGRRC